MILKMLLENTVCAPQFGCEHGLSLYGETERHKFLFDFGASDLFLKNADLLGVRLEDVDVAFLSHGHSDHGGGLAAFLARNSNAPIYVHKAAFQPYFAAHGEGSPIYIGLDPALEKNPQIRAVDGVTVIDDELTLFSGVTGRELFSETNRVLLEQVDGALSPDRFLHEQDLVVTASSGKRLLLAGCAHNGILNILARFEALFGGAPDVVVGGFHLSRPGEADHSPSINTTAIAQRLMGYPTRFYTCHCTGMPAFQVMKDLMGDQLQYFSAGQVVTLDF